MISIGIDPGLSGAIAMVTGDGTLFVRDMPVAEIVRNRKTKREILSRELAGTIRDFVRGDVAGAHVWIERVGAAPGQGVVSMFAFGRAVGVVEGIVGALELPMSPVNPHEWRRKLRVPDGKDGSRLRASQLFPTYAALWSRKRDDGRAEAVLIAQCGLMFMTHAPELAA